jgi:transcriptional regulator with PAS, ATPase and Fis domain
MKFKERVQNFERELIMQALKDSKSLNGAARKLGILRSTLFMKMKRLNIEITRQVFKVKKVKPPVTYSSE